MMQVNKAKKPSWQSEGDLYLAAAPELAVAPLSDLDPLIVAALNSTESAVLSNYYFEKVTSRVLGNLVVKFYLS